MEKELDKKCLGDLAEEIDWEGVSPAIAKLTTGPSFYLLTVVQRLERKIREELVDFDLTNTQFFMLTGLMLLTKSGKTVTQMDLANHRGADKMMVSEVLRTLEKKGYVVREDHPTDRRAKSLVVTEKGIATIEVALEHAVRFDEEFFAPLGNERDDLIRQLKKLL